MDGLRWTGWSVKVRLKTPRLRPIEQIELPGCPTSLMRSAKVTIPWKEGLHSRHATALVKRAMTFKSSILLKCKDQTADGRSILAVLLLGATFGTVLNLEAEGEDEDEALSAVSSVFGSRDWDADPSEEKVAIDEEA